jgi:hypothetical protein
MAARLDEDGRCVLTDCWPRECGCPDHRGGVVIPDLDTGQGRHRATEARDEADRTRDRWGSGAFAARFGGHCSWCETPFSQGVVVRYDSDDNLVGPCCAEIDLAPPELMGHQ